MKPSLIFRAGKGIVKSEAAPCAPTLSASKTRDTKSGVSDRREAAVSADASSNRRTSKDLQRNEMPNGPQREQPEISSSAATNSKRPAFKATTTAPNPAFELRKGGDNVFGASTAISPALGQGIVRFRDSETKEVLETVVNTTPKATPELRKGGIFDPNCPCCQNRRMQNRNAVARFRAQLKEKK